MRRAVGMTSTVTDHNASQAEIPSSWTAFSSQQLPQIGNAWSEAEPPAELTLLPADINLSPKLAEILHWSLHRPTQTAPATPRDIIEQIQAESSPSDKPKPVDEAQINNVISQEEPPKHSQRPVSSIKTAKNDVKAALDRVKNLRHRHDLERVVSLKRQTEIQAKIEQRAVTAECISCFEEFATEKVIKLSCSHSYCKECLSTLIMTALANESAFPPKCCLSEIPPEKIIIPLNTSQRDVYKAKAAEYSIPASRRWYCPNTACTKWIPPAKLQSNRALPQKCPYCSTKICSTCRGVAHKNVDCPQDFGLEATLDIAESEGWKRCYSCRTMVERNVGCRHITCRCGAEFCYVCGARWRTCGCTEVDEANRQAQLRQQRVERDAVAQAEAEEVARAIAAVELLTRREEARRQELERQRELERQQEEVELARLEALRLQEEEQRHREQEEAERQLREILRISILEEAEKLVHTLRQIFYHQHVSLDDRHGRNEQQLLQQISRESEKQRIDNEQLQASIQRNIEKRRDRLRTKHQEELRTMQERQELEQDDVFLRIQLRLKNQANREAREQRMLQEVESHQKEELEHLQIRHQKDSESLENTAKMEIKGLSRSATIKIRLNTVAHVQRLEQLRKVAAVERAWFQIICSRRKEMVERHNQIIMDAHNAGRESNGLTEDVARSLSPLPMMNPHISRPASQGSIQHTPVELEGSFSFPMTNSMNSRSSGQDEGKAPSSACSREAAPEIRLNDTALIASSRTLVASSSGMILKTEAGKPDQISPRTPTPEKEYPQSPPMKYGNAYLSTKNGESSKLFVPIRAPPTPPESSSFPQYAFESEDLRLRNAFLSTETQQDTTPARVGLRLSIPEQRSLVINSDTISTPPASFPAESRTNWPFSPSDIGTTYPVSYSYESSATDLAAKNKAPVREGSAATVMPPHLVPEVKKSRNPFRRHRLSDEEIRSRMRKAVGDAFA